MWKFPCSLQGAFSSQTTYLTSQARWTGNSNWFSDACFCTNFCLCLLTSAYWLKHEHSGTNIVEYISQSKMSITKLSMKSTALSFPVFLCTKLEYATYNTKKNWQSPPFGVPSGPAWWCRSRGPWWGRDSDWRLSDWGHTSPRSREATQT